MKYFLLVMALLGSVGLTACAVHTREGSIVVDPEGRLNDGHESFCPSGQTKKGNC